MQRIAHWAHREHRCAAQQRLRCCAPGWLGETGSVPHKTNAHKGTQQQIQSSEW